MLFASLFSDAADGQSLSEFERRLRRIEEQQEEQLVRAAEQQARPTVRSFLADHLTLGGFFESAATALTGPDTRSQLTSAQNILGLNFAAEFTDRMRFVSQFLTGLSVNQQNPHNDPNAGGVGLPGQRSFRGFTFGAVLSQAYLEYEFDPAFRLQGGVGYVPFGYAFQLRELVLFVRRGGPQALRTRKLAEPLWSGLHLDGFLPVGDGTWGYHLYTAAPLENPQVPGIGTRVWWSSFLQKATVGASAQATKLGADTYQSLGVDVRIQLVPFMFTAEYARALHEGNDPWSAYLTPTLAAFDEKWLFYVFADYATSPLNFTGTSASGLSDPYEKWEYGGGVNWLPSVFTRLRVGLTVANYVGPTAVVAGQDRDAVIVDLSAGVAF